jgi:cytochrome c biogenesis protein CcdA/thiol-disulfide isomerase/thioredoxin
MIILSLVAFTSGLLTILAPCIWPLLPIVLADVTHTSSKKRPLGVTAGVALSFTVITLSISTLESSLGLNPNFLRRVAVVVLLVIGLSMVIPKLSQRLEVLISRLAGRFGSVGKNVRSDFRGGFITGLALGVVWAPCSGPILGSIATLAATNQVSLQVVIVTLFYVAGVSIPLFAFAVGGQRLLTGSKRFSRYLGKIQIAAGLILILTAAAIYTNFDKTIEVKLLDAIPSFSKTLTKLESTKAVTNELSKLSHRAVPAPLTGDANSLFNADSPAPELQGINHWLNTPAPISLAALKGKVVLIDFWTYTCINCLRTLPHVEQWYSKYHSAGLEVIGVSTPEFAFEKDTGNVNSAIKRLGINYPVAQDNNYSTWNAYANQYWPAEYLIDAHGNIRREEFGEGSYAQMESAIQSLLKSAGAKVNQPLSTLQDTQPSVATTPETYLGSARADSEFPDYTLGNGTKKFAIQKSVPLNQFAFGGTWTIAPQPATAAKGSTLTEHFLAHNVYLILNPNSANSVNQVAVSLNGKPLVGPLAGSDVKNGIITLDTDRLYNIVAGSSLTNGVLTFTFQNPGISVYTFTFG